MNFTVNFHFYLNFSMLLEFFIHDLSEMFSAHCSQEFVIVESLWLYECGL